MSKGRQVLSRRYACVKANEIVHSISFTWPKVVEPQKSILHKSFWRASRLIWADNEVNARTNNLCMGRQHIAIQREQSDELFLKRFLRWSQTTGLQIKFPQVSQTLAHLFDTPDVSERYSYKLQSGLSDKFLSLPSQNLTLQVSSAGLVPCEFVKFPDMKKTCHTNHVHFCHIPKSQCVC